MSAMIKLGQRILMLVRGKSFLFLSKYNLKTALRHFIPTKPQNDILWICGGFCLVGIELDDGTGDETYLTISGETLPKIIHKFDPDMLFYQAGVDVLATDKLGKLSLSLAGCYERDKLVLTTAHKAGIPVAVVMGGGYSPEIETVVEAHCGVFGVAKIFI